MSCYTSPCTLTHHGTIRDQPDQGIGRQQTQADHQSFPQCFQFILIDTGVHDEEEDRRDLSRTGESVFDGGVFGQEFSGEIGSRNVFVVRRKGIALKAEGADPELSSDIDLARGGSAESTPKSIINLPIRVEDGFAGGLTRHRLIQDWR